MKLNLLGPLDTVTGSAYWLRDDLLGVQFLVDCGMQQGERAANAWNQQAWPFDPRRIDFVIATHAHVDHVGLIPRLYRDGFRGTVFATEETAALARIVLRDAVRHGAPYEASDIDRIHWHEHAGALFGLHHPVFDDVFIQYFRSAHIAGAISVRISWGLPPSRSGRPQRSILFSGDIGRNVEGEESCALMRHRHQLPASDYAVMESTYGATIRKLAESFDERIANTEKRLRDALSRGGPVIIPCFAVGRTQEVLFDLHYIMARDPDRYRDVRIVLDSPMAKRVNQVYAEALTRVVRTRNGVSLGWLSARMAETIGLSEGEETLLFDMLREILGTPAEDRKAYEARWAHASSIVRNWRRRWTSDAKARIGRGTVLVTGGGMCEGGPVVNHLQRFACESAATILLTGYASAATNGGKLLQLSGLPADQRSLLDGHLIWEDAEPLPVRTIRAHVERLDGYSAHADQVGLARWAVFRDRSGTARNVASKGLFLTHGEPHSREALATAIHRRRRIAGAASTPIYLPRADGRWFDLDADAWIDADGTDVERTLRSRIAALEAELAARP